MRLFAFIILTALLVGASPAHAEELDCARCHQNPAMAPALKNQFGVVESLYIDPAAFKESWHYKLGEKTKCVMCHKAITAFPHQREAPLRCSDCHQEDKKPEFIAIEERVKRSVHKALDCNECHDVHKNKPAEAMTLSEKNRGCLKCHEYGLGPGIYQTLAPIEIQAYHSWHPQAALHLSRMACIVCHTSIEKADIGQAMAESDKHLILDKSNATRECSVCHSGESKVAEYLIDVGPGEKSGLTRQDLLERIYLVGGTRNKWIEIIGGSVLLMSILGVFAHAAGRVVLGGRS